MGYTKEWAFLQSGMDRGEVRVVKLTLIDQLSLIDSGRGKILAIINNPKPGDGESGMIQMSKLKLSILLSLTLCTLYNCRSLH